ncbi:Alcohol dehydrogenase GroES-like domain-containing protein [Fontibacillus panacisegetis]|uniref:Alcohol dehydrogenase GroES-like domain-containing protein n=1 Tax=Fontibacillus panacisegetis TaxID=670482 RepID=A0A1G7ECA0_9BACL|nr:alcohol dehydrogenase catalytic domain-containing protein [Fontibacillus panacisegetis]SDE61283.1 Alcohol dehydrogenase GroES-like domain-containing protein [Fontibacillus panacisegetis]
MQALRWHGVKDLRLEAIDEPSALEGKVKIKVEWCGICGSDLHKYVAGPIFIPENTEHPLTGEKAPIVMGHEFSGQIDVFPSVISLMGQGYFPADKLVTKKIKLAEVVDNGFEALLKEKNQVKILVSPQK